MFLHGQDRHLDRGSSRLTKSKLFAEAEKANLFVEIDANQKERIVKAVRSYGHVFSAAAIRWADRKPTVPTQ